MNLLGVAIAMKTDVFILAYQKEKHYFQEIT